MLKNWEAPKAEGGSSLAPGAILTQQQPHASGLWLLSQVRSYRALVFLNHHHFRVLFPHN